MQNRFTEERQRGSKKADLKKPMRLGTAREDQGILKNQSRSWVEASLAPGNRFKNSHSALIVNGNFLFIYFGFSEQGFSV